MFFVQRFLPFDFSVKEQTFVVHRFCPSISV